MQYYPIFLKLRNERIAFSGGGAHAAAKIRLLMKTEAQIFVFDAAPCQIVREWALDKKIKLFERALTPDDVINARLVYGANDEPIEDARAVKIGRDAGALSNIVDNLDESDFLTPAIVDRDPVVVAIGTEGTAPVLARKIKSQIEESLSASTGQLARIASSFRPAVAALKSSTHKRKFWQKFFSSSIPKSLEQHGEQYVRDGLADLLAEARNEKPGNGQVDLIGTGPGDPDLLTLKARRKIESADVVLHDRLVSNEILELARREATVICVGKKGYGPSWKQEDINQLMVSHVRSGKTVARLKSGDPAIYGRLDEELDFLENAGIDWEVVPGITTASAAAANIGSSLTSRGRNSSFRIVTGRDLQGYAEQDWASLAKPNSVAAIYMGVKASKFLTGRLLMHGADPNAPVTIIENVSRRKQSVLTTTIGGLQATLEHEEINGPAILLLGLTPRHLNAVTFTGTELQILTGTGN